MLFVILPFSCSILFVTNCAEKESTKNIQYDTVLTSLLLPYNIDSNEKEAN